MSADVRLGVGLAVLLILAISALTLAGVRARGAVLFAAVRAAAQLSLVALALRGVFAAPLAVIAVVSVMFSVVVWTGSRRLRAHPGALRAVALSCAAGAG